MATSGRKIRVVQVIGTMHIGGAENAVVNLARGLDRSRFDVALCCTRDRGVLAEQLASEGIEVRMAAPPRASLRYLTPLYLRGTLRRLGADIVHTHGTPSLLHAGPLAVVGALPWWVHTFHYGNYPLPSRKQMAGERVLCKQASRLVAVSETQRQAIIDLHGVRPDHITTIVNGVDANPFVDDPSVRARKRAELGVGPEEILIGGLAVLTRQKGIPYLLQAAGRLVDRDRRLRFLVAGGGPLEASLREEADRLGLGSRVIFTGWRQDNLELVTALDIFVMASLWEAMPLALLEAMAARRAIVVTDVGDNRKVVADGACGLVVPPADADAIAAAVSRLIASPEEARQMAERAGRRFADRFTTAHMVHHYETVFAEGWAAGRRR